MDRVDNIRIGVGVSGGADSAAVCLELVEAGYDVMGFTMLLADNGSAAAEKGARVAARLGIPHVVLDFRSEFEREIIVPFVDAYAAGRTPSPCVVCNVKFKFGALWHAMAAHGCTRMATGHYARLCLAESGSGYRMGLYRGVDGRKDQSYFLAQLHQDQLSRAMFPLGWQQKTDIRERVQALGLVEKSERESQDLCFLPYGDFAPFVAARRMELLRPGPIVDLSGRELGWHGGAFQFTPGQRRGLGLGGGPWFVVKTDTASNVVTVAHGDEMACGEVMLGGMNWLVKEPAVDEEFAAAVQIRYLMKPRAAVLVPQADGRARLVFKERVTVAPPGQLAVAYDGDRVVASGWIE